MFIVVLVAAAHRCVKQILCCADTYMDDESWVVFFQPASEPQEVLVAPAYLILTGVELTPRGLQISSKPKGDYYIIKATARSLPTCQASQLACKTHVIRCNVKTSG